MQRWKRSATPVTRLSLFRIIHLALVPRLIKEKRPCPRRNILAYSLAESRDLWHLFPGTRSAGRTSGRDLIGFHIESPLPEFS